MNARLTSTEILAELKAALGEDGWLPSYTRGNGPGPLPQDAPLPAVGEALGEYARVVPSTEVATQLSRAAQQMTGVKQLDEGAATYERLGTALAYLVQARRATGDHLSRL
ncbi:hypothetical protein GCM10023323_71780 [Streptomyces thinghirensis]|uniref:Uncharacterized protein n=1 Tax=Streptomyces thinghirensis TaxID=551547 RepID=A0ABP9TDF4_9ACTN